MVNHSLLKSLKEQIVSLEPYLQQLLRANSPYKKLEVISQHPFVKKFLENSKDYPFLFGQSPDYDLSIRSVLAIGQGPVVFSTNAGNHINDELLRRLLQTLLEVDRFYAPIGGIIGYHIDVLKLIYEKESDKLESDLKTRYERPLGIDLTNDSRQVRKLVREGIARLPEMAEIYPIGGAGDRLNLHDDTSGEPLPAARLLFTGRNLLEGLIRDLQAREYLYYKLFHKQVVTPVAMMTSHEKSNHQHICEICGKNQWFGRPPRSLMFFIQPLAPVITKEGNWSLSDELKLNLKPGGHGVIWKLALDEGVISALKS